MAAVVIVPADGVTAGVMEGVTVGVTAIDPPVLLPVPSIGFITINAPPAITRIAIIIAAIVIPMRFFDAGLDAGAGGCTGGSAGGVSPAGVTGTDGAGAPSPAGAEGGDASAGGSIAAAGVSTTTGVTG